MISSAGGSDGLWLSLAPGSTGVVFETSGSGSALTETLGSVDGGAGALIDGSAEGSGDGERDGSGSTGLGLGDTAAFRFRIGVDVVGEVRGA